MTSMGKTPHDDAEEPEKEARTGKPVSPGGAGISPSSVEDSCSIPSSSEKGAETKEEMALDDVGGGVEKMAPDNSGVGAGGVEITPPDGGGVGASGTEGMRSDDINGGTE